MAGIDVAPELKKGRNKLAVTVVLGHAIKHIYNSGLSTILLPEIKLGLGLSATQLGTLAFSRQMAGWFTTVAAGYLGDRFANKAAIMLGISMTLMGISYFFAGFAPNYLVMLLAMLFVGIGPSMYHPPAIGALSRRFPDKRGFAISLHGTGGSIGEVIGPLVTAGLLTFLVWRQVLQISVVPAIFAGFIIWGMMRSVKGEASGTSSTSDYFKSIGALLRKGKLAILVGVTALRSMGQSAIMIFLPVYLREDLAYSAATVAIYLSMAQVVGMFAQPAMGYISDRLGRKIVLVPSMMIMGFLFFALTYADPGWQLIITILALGTFLYSLHTIFIAAAMDVAGEEVQSTVVSLIYGASFIGTLSPVFAGIIADKYGTEYTFLYGGVMILLAAFGLAITRLPKTANQLAQERVQ
jgi:MFS family permease